MLIKIIKNNFFIKLVSILLAIIAWFLIVNISNPMVNVTIENIAVKTINDQLIYNNEKSFALENNGSVDVQIYGRRTKVEKLTYKDFDAVADLEKLSLTNAVEVNISLKKDDSDVLILNNRKLLNVRIENIIKTPFPITPKAIGKPKQEMAVGAIDVSPQEVEVRGPESLIHNIKEIEALIDVKGKASNVSGEAELKAYDNSGNIINSANLRITPKTVRLKAHISKIKSIPVQLIKVPKAKDGYGVSEIIVNPSHIDVVAPKDVMDKYTKIEIPYSVKEFGELTDTTITKSLNILDYIPENIKLASQQEKVSVKISVLPKIEKTVKLESSQINFINKDNEFSYKVEPSQIEVIAIATEPELSKLKASDYQATIDAKFLNQWSKEAPLKITTYGTKDITFNKTTVKVKITKE